jgi:GGDEF domain-containing protein
MSDDFPDPRSAERLTRAARAAQTLSETLWEALHEELNDPRQQRVAELTQQLREIAATLGSLAHVRESIASEEPEPRAARPRDEPTTEKWSPAQSSETFVPLSPAPSPEAPSPLSPAVLIDELAPGAGTRIEIRDERREEGARHEEGLRREEGLSRDEGYGREEGPAAWIGSIGRRLERYERDAAPFAVLLVELVDIERLHHSEPVGEVSRLAAQVEDALARELRPADSLTSESPGRYWLLAPQTDGMAAQMLAERIARAVRSSASHRGTPLEVATGIAVCPDDGLKASELAAHADVALYAERAAGRAR